MFTLSLFGHRTRQKSLEFLIFCQKYQASKKLGHIFQFDKFFLLFIENECHGKC